MVDQNPTLKGVAQVGPRFFGRRKGRPLRASMKRLLDESLPKIIFDPMQKIEHQFGRHGDYYLEIGFGGGEFLASLAVSRPECNFIGAEPFINGVASLLRHVDEKQLENIRIWPDDVRLILPTIGLGSLAGAFIMFPDPWPKRRHAERRILQLTLLDQLANIIRPGGNLTLASDDPVAKSWLLLGAMSHSDFVWTARHPDDWRKLPKGLSETRYMKKAERAGRRPSWFQFRRSGLTASRFAPPRGLRL